MTRGGGLIPLELVEHAVPSDPETAEALATRLLPAVERLGGRHESDEVAVRRMPTGGDVTSFRIDVAGSPYFATITEYSVIEAYHVERRRGASGRRRTEMHPVLVEVTHIFTVEDGEGVLVSVSDAVPVLELAADDTHHCRVFGDLFEAARSTDLDATIEDATGDAA